MKQPSKQTSKKPTETRLFGTFSLRDSSIVRLFYISVALFFAAALLLGLALATEYRVHQVPSSQAQKGYSVGTKLSVGASDFTLTDVRFEPGTGVFETPGKVYAIATIRITNRSDRAIQIIPTTDSYIKDASSIVHYIAPYKLANPFRAGELPAGETIQGELSYVVPTSGKLKFYVNSSWSGGVLSYAIR